METRLQYIFLIAIASLLTCATAKAQENEAASTVDTEFLEVGVSLGTLAIEGFPTTFSKSLNFTFRATESFFLEINYLLADGVKEATFPETRDDLPNSLADNRDFRHFDLLLGYNIFQGEFFSGAKTANLSSLYAVWGAGETEFAEERRFTTTLGLGYQIAFKRRYILHFDMRDYIYQSSLGSDDKYVHNIDSSVGLSYLF